MRLPRTLASLDASEQYKQAVGKLMLGSALMQATLETGQLGRFDVRSELDVPSEKWGLVKQLSDFVSVLGTANSMSPRQFAATNAAANAAYTAQALRGLAFDAKLMGFGSIDALEGLEGLDGVIDWLKKKKRQVQSWATEKTKEVGAAIKGAAEAVVDATKASINFIKDKYERIMRWKDEQIQALKDTMKQFDITTPQGEKFICNIAKKVFFPSGTSICKMIGNTANFIKCLKQCDTAKDILSCLAEFIVQALKDVVTSAEFGIILGWFTQNWPLLIASAIRLTGEGLMDVVKDPVYRSYIKTALAVAGEGIQIAMFVYTQKGQAFQNPALYVMVGELLRAAGQPGTDIYVMGGFVSDHAQIVAKIVGGRVDDALEQLRIKYVDPVTKGFRNVDASTLASWAVVAAACVAIAASFERCANATTSSSLLRKTVGGIKPYILQYAQMFKHLNTTIGQMINTVNKGKTFLAAAQTPGGLERMYNDAISKTVAQTQALQAQVNQTLDIEIVKGSIGYKQDAINTMLADSRDLNTKANYAKGTGVGLMKQGFVAHREANAAYTYSTDPNVREYAKYSAGETGNVFDKGYSMASQGAEIQGYSEMLNQEAIKTHQAGLADAKKLQEMVAARDAARARYAASRAQ